MIDVEGCWISALVAMLSRLVPDPDSLHGSTATETGRGREPAREPDIY